MVDEGERRIAHGWLLGGGGGEEMLEAAAAVPPGMAARVGLCRIAVRERLEGAGVVSAWSRTERGFDIELAAGGIEPHEVALELLRCVGQALWEKLPEPERAAYLKLLEAEIEAGVSGEIDEDALERKRALFASRGAARNPRLLLEYAAASFAGTAAEYAHALWHDVTVRVGPEHLEAAWLRRRLEFLARRFPPAPGRRLFA
jgi:hypothetical protein